MCDIIRQSAEGHTPRVFVVEVLGGLCGYLTSMTGKVTNFGCYFNLFSGVFEGGQ